MRILSVKIIWALIYLLAAPILTAAETKGQTREITVAAISIATLDGALESNYDRAYRLCEIALEEKPDIILLPEAFAAGYCTTNVTEYAETRKSPHLKKSRTYRKSINA